MIFQYQTKRFLFLAALFFSYFALYSGADLIIFSFDRPLQLYALLESINTHITGVDEVRIVYRSSNDAFEQGYNKVKNYFPSAQFMRQSPSPSSDFKPLTLDATFDSSSPYVIFAVDDIIVKDLVDLDRSIELLESTKAYGFYLRQGLHLTYNYPHKCAQPLPPVEHVVDDVYLWTFAHGSYDWRYPLMVDMALYRKKDIEPYFRALDYTNPNTLEGNWSTYIHKVVHQQGLFYKLSKIINIPVNLVNTTTNNRHMNAYTTQELLDIFNSGLKIDIKKLYQIQNNGGHMEYEFTFIQRS